jgi:hypothetical protein
MAAVYDRIARAVRAQPPLQPYEVRRREARAVGALPVVAARRGNEERATAPWVGRGHDEGEDEDDRIAREHGFSTDRLIALRAPGS